MNAAIATTAFVLDNSVLGGWILANQATPYGDVLGRENGDRPPLGFPGYWLYSGGVATVHLLGERKPREGIVVRGTEKKFDDTGRFDHIAFAASDLPGVRQRLQSKNVKFREQIVPRTGAAQIFLYDPDGVGVELNFPPEEVQAEARA